MEDTPILTIVLGALLVLGLGYEAERRRKRLREVFNVFDRQESKVAAALEAMVESGALRPYSPGQPA